MEESSNAPSPSLDGASTMAATPSWRTSVGNQTSYSASTTGSSQLPSQTRSFGSLEPQPMVSASARPITIDTIHIFFMTLFLPPYGFYAEQCDGWAKRPVP